MEDLHGRHTATDLVCNEQSGGEMIANGRGEQRKGKRAPFAFYIRYIGFIHVFSKTYKVKYSEWVSVQQEHYSIRRST